MKKNKNKYRRVFIFCIFTSLFIHIFTLAYLHKHLLSFSLVNKYFSPQMISDKKEVIPKLKEEDILTFTFEQNKKKYLQEAEIIETRSPSEEFSKKETLPMKKEISDITESLKIPNYSYNCDFSPKKESSIKD